MVSKKPPASGYMPLLPYRPVSSIQIFGLDLGQGHVRRAGLFVWQFGLPMPRSYRIERRQHLVKTDRSGGTQVPENDSQQVN